MKTVELVITTYEYKNPGERERYSKTGITLNLDGKELPRKHEFNNPCLVDEAVKSVEHSGDDRIDTDTLFWLLAEEYRELADYEVFFSDADYGKLIIRLKPNAEGRERFRVYRLEAELEKTKKELEEMTRKYDKKVSDERWSRCDCGYK